ncbi:malto-oligosyltrehalose synthase [Actinomadura sp. NPDC047616]|uniref:malto-oligosyltrehalose synthase n=1 Tax=Actinomadura sp. NPDC047616 TaxID=3155914 RepID=UPI0033F60D6E
MSDGEAARESPLESTRGARVTAHPPTGTYRLQLRGGAGPERFGFAEAAALAPYLEALGVSHVYLSPILQAAPGSTHGYDVVDPTRLSEDLGGEEAFRAMTARFRSHGLRVLVDVVPNHMAIPVPPTLNRAYASVLEEGAGSPYARWFDVDWDAGGGRIVPPGEGEPNYRRFFDISGLIALRQEDPEVFAETHRLLLRLVAEGQVDGLRVDHPDGLSDPRGYLERLRAEAGGCWLLVEKITTGAEELPTDWPCAGTTGYDALGMVGGLFLDPDGEQPLTETYAALTGGTPDFREVEFASRRYVAEHGLRPEVARLHRVLCGALPARPKDTLERVLVELLVAMPVYRAYVVPGEKAPAQASDVLAQAAERARQHLPPETHPDMDAVVRLALGLDPDESPAPADPGVQAARREFVVRFQQTSAPLAAKGVEDTAFYRWSRLVSLNEVGGDPARFSVSPGDFHAFCARQARDWPTAMTTLSTHDTKRQEDVRARLAVLSEMAGPWAAAVRRWRAWAGDGSPLEPDLDYLLWQTLVGAWPIEEGRLTEFLTKAMREAKTRTSWLDGDPGYEAAVLAHARRVLEDADLVADLATFVSQLEPYARVVMLGQKIVQLTMPGVPDVYQGCELVGLSLVDPDNRRPVDYGSRRARLAHLDAEGAPRDVDDLKLLITSRALRLRRDHPEWFSASYEPARVTGATSAHAVAYLRGSGALSGRGGRPGDARVLTLATRLPVGLEIHGGWGETTVDVPAGRWHDRLTGRVHEAGGPLPLAELLADLPVALLVREEPR